MFPELGVPALVTIGVASLLAVLLVLCLRPRAPLSGHALIRLAGVARARREGGFLLATGRVRVPVLCEGVATWLRIGDRLQVLGTWRDLPRAESLYREPGCERALDAAAVVRVPRWRPALRLLALLPAVGGAGFLGLLALVRAGEAFEVPIPVEVLEPGRALLAPLACPEGAETRDVPVRDPSEAGWLRYCALANGTPHGPAIRLDLLGRVRARGEHRRGHRHGRWVTHSQRDPYLVVCDYEHGERHGLFLEEGFGRRVRGEYRRGREHGRWDRVESSGFTSRGYDEGVPEGFWIEPGVQGHYRRGRRHGSWTLERERLPELLATHYSHRLTAHVTYDDGVREGPAVWLDGQQIVARGSYRHDKLHGRWQRLGDSQREDRLLEEVTYLAGRRDGPARLYAPDGAIAAEGSYLRGERVGRWSFSSAGQLATGNYEAGRRVGLWRFLRGDRRALTVVAEGRYRYGLRHGSWREYPPGSPVVERRYHAGRLLGGAREGPRLRSRARLLLVRAGGLGESETVRAHDLPLIDLAAFR